MQSNSSALILCDIRSMENVGSIFRTADAIGIEKLYLCGITPAPIDRFGRSMQAIAKAALGAEKNVPWEKIEDASSLIHLLKKEGCSVVAIEQSSDAIDYKKVKINFPVVLMLGNEVSGLSGEVLALADTIAEIPMKGKKESLNVAVAAGIALYRLLDQ